MTRCSITKKIYGCTNLKDKELSWALIGIIGLFFLLKLHFPGLRTLLGFSVFYIVPFYYLLPMLEKIERIIISIFLGLGAIPTFVFYVGAYIGLWQALVVCFVILAIAAYFVHISYQSSYKKEKTS